MKNVVICGVVVLAIGAYFHFQDSHESAVKDGIKTLNEITDLLNAIGNGESAKEAKPKLKKLVVRFRELKYRLDRLGNPTKDQKDEFTEKYYPEYQDALKRWRKALAKAASDPEAAKIIEQIFDEELPTFPDR